MSPAALRLRLRVAKRLVAAGRNAPYWRTRVKEIERRIAGGEVATPTPRRFRKPEQR